MGATWMTIDDRRELERQYNEGISVRKIAQDMGRHFSGVYREIQYGYTGRMDKNGRPGYSADLGQEHAYKVRMAFRERNKEKAQSCK